jgi:PAS domain S-box-containing protein
MNNKADNKGNYSKDSLAKYKLFFEKAPIGIVFYNKKGIVTDVNNMTIKIFGSSRQKLIGLNLKNNPDKTFTKEVIRSLNGQNGFYEGEHTSLTGSKTSFLKCEWIPLKNNNIVYGGVGIIKNISERKKNEDKISSLATLVEQAFQTIIITDLNGIITYVNPAFKKITGYDTKEIIGQNPHILSGGRHSKEFYKGLWHTIKSGNIWHGEFYNKKKNKSFYYENAIIFPIKNTKGEIIKYAAIKQDVTEHKKTQAQLHQSQKMESIGTLAGGIAHDFNNVLGIIMGYTELTMDEVSENKELTNNLIKVMNASERARYMVQQILSFSRKDITQMQYISIEKVIKETVKFIRGTIPSTIHIKSNIMNNQGKILGNKTQITQIIVNLCLNATYAMKTNGGTLEITLIDTESTKENPIENLKIGTYKLIQVKDTGIGMEKEILDKIFEPYFTTKKIGKGTGLGLSVTYGIIKNHHGYIYVTSQLGIGSVFSIYLPVVKDIDTKEKNNVEKIFIRKNREKILFVDDEKDLINLGTKILQSLGYKVTSKNNSIEALNDFKKNSDNYDILITDNTMPNMTGIKLVEKIHKIRPDLPVILCTGFSDDIGHDNYKKKGIDALIMKPIRKKHIEKAVRDVLNNKLTKNTFNTAKTNCDIQ